MTQHESFVERDRGVTHDTVEIQESGTRVVVENQIQERESGFRLAFHLTMLHSGIIRRGESEIVENGFELIDTTDSHSKTLH